MSGNRSDLFKVTVFFQVREDGGLRAWSNDVPGFVLSHSDADAVLDDVGPALEVMLSAKFGAQVVVKPLTDFEAFTVEPQLPIERRTVPTRQEYASQIAA